MIKLKFVVLLAVFLLLVPAVVLASDISDAEYYGLITISNNSTATTNVAVNCTISTQSLIDGGYLNSSANNCVILNTSGSDMPFMPSVNSTYPWAMWVPSIGADSYLSYLLYTNATGGEIRYFPGSGGMTTPDNASLELSDNFTIEQKGWVDTSYSANKTLVFKEDAFKTYISGTGNITSVIPNPTNYITPTGDNDPGGDWANEINAYDDNVTTFATDSSVGDGNWSGYLELTHSVVYCDQVRWRVGANGGGVDKVDVDAYYNGSWYDVYEGAFTYDAWTTSNITGIHLVDNIRVRLQNNAGANRNCYIYEADYIVAVSVTATSISSGEHTVTTSANLTSLGIWVDGDLKDNTALTANVTDTSDNWVFLENAVMPYMEHHKIWVGGVLQQHIEWEYDTTFTDLSGNSHDATPTFRTTSSDADVSAELTLFQPTEEAQAPAFSLATTGGTIVTENLTTTGNFTTIPGPTGFPGKTLIEAVASASGTPAQLPFTVLAGFIIIGISLTLTYFMHQHGTGSLFIKIAVIITLMGIFIALQVLDFWLLIFFILIAIALAMASKQAGWT